MLRSRRGSTTQTTRRDVEPEGRGRATATALNDERHRRAGFLSVHSLGLPDRAGAFPERQGYSGTRAGVEADEEVAMSSVRFAGKIGGDTGSLRRELGHRAEEYARTHRLPHCLSYGQQATVCFEPYDNASRHGNFLPSTYRAILRNPNWRRRLQKVHSQGRKFLPRDENGIQRELDICTSSDALLMNVFCYPGVFRGRRVYSMLDVKSRAIPEFGFRARVPLANGKFDRTEVDMRLGDLLFEAKLTEGDFQRAPKAVVRAYRDFSEAFDGEDLPQTDRDFLSYQLIRNVLAAHASGCTACVLTDARRPELIESWYAVVKCVRPIDLRIRCKVLTWQELASVTPRGPRDYLGEKYGIDALA
jgi:restriction endonuclease-like protein